MRFAAEARSEGPGKPLPESAEERRGLLDLSAFAPWSRPSPSLWRHSIRRLDRRGRDLDDPYRDQGACEIKAGDASLQIMVETGNAATVFDAVRSSATAPQPVTGIGDQGFTTTDPANAIVILSGDTMVAIGMSRSPTGGPADDPAEDQPILRDLS